MLCGWQGEVLSFNLWLVWGRTLVLGSGDGPLETGEAWSVTADVRVTVRVSGPSSLT